MSDGLLPNLTDVIFLPSESRSVSVSLLFPLPSSDSNLNLPGFQSVIGTNRMQEDLIGRFWSCQSQTNKHITSILALDWISVQQSQSWNSLNRYSKINYGKLISPSRVSRWKIRRMVRSLWSRSCLHLFSNVDKIRLWFSFGSLSLANPKRLVDILSMSHRLRLRNLRPSVLLLPIDLLRQFIFRTRISLQFSLQYHYSGLRLQESRIDFELDFQMERNWTRATKEDETVAGSKRHDWEAIERSRNAVILAFSQKRLAGYLFKVEVNL